ncbi:MAG: DpnD/PcfM family protein [Proteiniphilum sp.]
MNTFEIEIKETLSTVIKVEAENQNDAIEKLKEMYRNEEIVLDAEDYKDTDITPFINDSLIQEIIKNNLGDERKILEKILCFIGISENKSNLIAIEAGGSQCIVNEDYLLDIGIPDYFRSKAMDYINMFYRGELSLI